MGLSKAQDGCHIGQQQGEFVLVEVMLVLVLIENSRGDKLISGKKCTEKELRKKVKEVIEITKVEDFAPLFCRMFQFDEQLLDKEIEVDYVIDLDTHLVYAPRY